MSQFKTPDGALVDVDADHVQAAIESGYTPVGGSEASDLATARDTSAESGIGGAISAGVGSIASGATLGLSDVALRGVLTKGDMQSMHDARELHPYVSTAGQIAGALAPALLGSEAGLARLSPSGFTSSIGARIAERNGGKLLGSVASGAFEGAAQNAGAYVSDVALGNRDLSSEGFLASMGKGAFYGGVGAGALSVSSNGLIAARRLFPVQDLTPEGVRAAKFGAQRAIGDSVETAKGLELAGQDAVVKTDRETQQFISDLEQERAKAMQGAAEVRTAQEAGGVPQESAMATGSAPIEGAAPAVDPVTGEPAAPVTPPKTARELMGSWRDKYPQGAVDFDAATAASRKQRLSEWAKDFEAKTPEDATIKAYFNDPQDPLSTDARVGIGETPKAVQDAARKAAADAAHEAYIETTAQGANVSRSGVELHARATYEGRKAAARAMDDVYAAYAAGKPIVDIRAAATQRLSGQLHELAEARADMIKSLAGQPADLTDKLKATLASMKNVDPNQPMSMMPRATTGAPAAKLSLGQRILQGVEKPVGPDEAVESALAKSKDVNEDISAIAPKITRYEAAKANLTEALGPQASQQAQEHAAQFRAAQQAAQEANAKVGAQTVETADAASRGVPAKALPGGKSMIGGLAKKASDLGTVYELMRSVGVPLPDPHSIPVIGPILSMYLKAKVLGKAFGKHGGSFAATAEGTIAAKAAETQNRLNGAVSKMLNNAGERLSAHAADIGGASALGYKLFDASSNDKPYSSKPVEGDLGKLYTDRLGELSAAMQPDAIAKAVKQRVNTSDPTILNAIINAETNRLTYLYGKAPKPDEPAYPGQPQRLPSKVEMVGFGQVLAAAHDPAAVFERVADGGTARPSEIECIHNCYPQLVAAAQAKLVDMLSKDGKALPYMRRVAVSALVGIPMDSTLKPEHVAYLAQANNSAAKASSLPGIQAPHPTLTSSISIGDRTMTRLDR